MPKEKKFTTVSIPTVLFDAIRKRIKHTSFPSVSSYIAYILREMEAGKKRGEKFTREDEERIKKKLREMGYLE